MTNDKAPTLKELKAKKKKLEGQAAATKDLIVQLVLNEKTDEVNQHKHNLQSIAQKLEQVSDDIKNINRLAKRDSNDRFISTIQRKFKFSDNQILDEFLTNNSDRFSAFIASAKTDKSTSEQEENDV